MTATPIRKGPAMSKITKAAAASTALASWKSAVPQLPENRRPLIWKS